MDHRNDFRRGAAQTVARRLKECYGTKPEVAMTDISIATCIGTPLEHLIERAIPKQCFYNSLKGLMLLRESGLHGRYCLGFHFIKSVYGFPVEHAWIEVDGVFYDPTLEKLSGFKKISECRYRLDIQMEWQDLVDYSLDLGYAPSLCDVQRKTQPIICEATGA